MIYDDQPQMVEAAQRYRDGGGVIGPAMFKLAFAAIDPEKLIEKVLSGVDPGWDVRRGQIEAVLVVAGILPDVEGIK